MEGEVKEGPIPKTRISPERKFVDILGLDTFPEKPSDLPAEFTLPPEITREFERVSLQSFKDGNEFSNMVFWDEKSGRFKFSRTFRGYPTQTSIISQFYKPYKTSGVVKQRPFISFHTHPPDNDNYEYPHSAIDISGFLSGTKGPYIDVVMSRRKMYVLVSTRQSQNQAPRSLRKFFVINTAGVLEQRGHNNPNTSTLEEAQLLESFGLGIYTWTPPEDKLKQEDMSNGLTLSNSIRTSSIGVPVTRKRPKKLIFNKNLRNF